MRRGNPPQIVSAPSLGLSPVHDRLAHDEEQDDRQDDQDDDDDGRDYRVIRIVGVEGLLLVQTADGVVDYRIVGAEAVFGVLHIPDVIVVCDILRSVGRNGDGLYAVIDLLTVDLEVCREVDIRITLVLQRELQGDRIDDLQRYVLLCQQCRILRVALVELRRERVIP